MENMLSGQLVSENNGVARRGRATTWALWTVQVLLALLFLMTGSMKLALPIEMLTAQTPLPGLLIRFLGVAEVLGALGLILPALFRIKRFLTPLAACGLIIIMLGAIVSTILTMGFVPALMPLVIGLLLAFIVYGRRTYFAR